MEVLGTDWTGRTGDSNRPGPGGIRRDRVAADGVVGIGPAAGDAGSSPDRPLDASAYPYRLWREAKKVGIWNPDDIDLGADAADWTELSGPERDLLLRLAVQFRGGEVAVTRGLLPFMNVIASEGRLEEELYLTSLLAENAKHVEMFDRFLTRVSSTARGFERYETRAWRNLFTGELRAAMSALLADSSPEAQVRAPVTCHLCVQGVLAQTGYHAYHVILERRGILRGMQRAIQYIKRDESRHASWGEYLIGRLIAEHGDAVWELVKSRAAALVEPSLDIVRDVADAYDVMPFDLDVPAFMSFARSAFSTRLSRLEATRTPPSHDRVHLAAG